MSSAADATTAPGAPPSMLHVTAVNNIPRAILELELDHAAWTEPVAFCKISPTDDQANGVRCKPEARRYCDPPRSANIRTWRPRRLEVECQAYLSLTITR